MERVQSASLRLADRTAAEVVALWARVEAGTLTESRFRAEAAAAIAAANAAGVHLADLGLAAEVTRQLRRPTNPVGLRPTDVQVDQARIAVSLASVLAETPESVPGRLSVFARSEPLLTVATAVQTGMARHRATGWVRKVDRDPCKLCTSWADGKVRSADTRMARHVGCGCLQSPVF